VIRTGRSGVPSDHEYYGPMIPRVMRLLHDGKYDDATEIYWQLHPVRKAKAALRKGLQDGGLTPSMDPFREFFTGRNLA
jgi:4-hydroxy-tetrahydrodipicolinate synthase